MESGSQTDASPGRMSNRVADIVGTLIALLTLFTPMMAIAYFSSANPPSVLSTSPPMRP